MSSTLARRSRCLAAAASAAWALAAMAAPPTPSTPSTPSGSASARSASGPQWGAAPAPRANASASTPAEDVDDRANGDYFHDFAALMVRLRSVGWLADICSEAFPGDADLERRAFADWQGAHRTFIDEMEGQFASIDRRWAAAASQGVTTAALKAKLEANRAALRDDFLARPVALQRKRCDAYPTLLLSRPLDLEHAQADLVRSVRRGPPAP